MADSVEGDRSYFSQQWIMVSSQGEILGGDGESETSESSIEIVDVDSDQGVSSGSSPQQKEEVVVVQSDSPCVNLPAVENNESNKEIAAAPVSCSEGESGLQDDRYTTQNASTLIVNSITRTEDKPVILDTTTTFQESQEEESSNIEVLDVLVKSTTSRTSSAGDISSICECHRAIDPSSQDEGIGTSEETPPPLEMISLGVKKKTRESNLEGSDFLITGACCSELLAESLTQKGVESAQSSNSINEPSGSGPVSVSNTESEMTGLPQFRMSADGQGNKSESDSDSDFICLDPHIPEDIESVVYAVSRENSEERVVIPLRLSRTDSSIGPGFNFMRDEPGVRAYQGDNEGVDEDRDDDTESTEDGVDDRIESEQSEAGSELNQNDVGDLSTFGDIGDLPLVVGNVARNYIHRPNNHLSTVLNTIMVLAAFLTMGLSLGIMVATDLEIEEWQTAYEMQTRKLTNLELNFEQQKMLKTDLYLQFENLKLAFEIKAQRVSKLEIELAQLLEEKKNSNGQFTLDTTDTDEMVGSLHQKQLQGFNYVSAVEMFMNHEFDLSFVKSTNNQEVKPKSDNIEIPMISASDKLQYDNIDMPMKSACYKLQVEDNKQQSAIEDIRPTYYEVDDDLSDVPRKDDLAKGHNMEELKGIKEKRDVQKAPGKDKKIEQNPTGSAASAVWIPLDVGQLQQSLSREQERALHWQQLYLAEHRQREHERDSEILEDQRDRVRWEQEVRDRDSGLECLHKLMDTDLSTLTQFITRWNVSVYDDFTNLSMLMSTVAVLRKSVVDSVQRVVEGAEEVFDTIRQEGEEKVHSMDWRESIPLAYVNQLLRDVERRVKELFKNNDGQWGEGPQENSHGHTEVHEEQRKPFGDDNNKEEWGSEIGSQDRYSEIKKEERVFQDRDREKSYRWLVNDDEEEGLDIKEEEEVFLDTDREKLYRWSFNNKEECWFLGLKKILHKTKKSMGKFGKRLRSIVHKVRDIWYKKKPVITSVAKEMGQRVVKITKNVVSHLSHRLNLKLFKESGQGTKEGEMDIDSKIVQNIRYRWQQQVMKHPCEILGDASAECNMKRKQRTKQLKAINIDFKGLMKLRIDGKTSKISLNKASQIHEKLTRFLDKWQGCKLILKSDRVWLDCQTVWWSFVVDALSKDMVMSLPENKCRVILLADTGLNPEQPPDGRKEHKEAICAINDKDEDGGEGCSNTSHNDDEHESDAYVSEDEGENKDNPVMYESNDLNQPLLMESNIDDQKVKANLSMGSREYYSQRAHSPTHDNDDKEKDHELNSDLERTRHRLYRRRETEKAGKDSRRASSLKFKLASQETNHLSSDWLFRKAEDREHQRELAEQSDWLFERARSRQGSLVVEQNSGDNEPMLAPNWFLEQSKERERLREQEHQSDWLFERASDRRKTHHMWNDYKKVGHGHRESKHSKHNTYDEHSYKQTHGKHHFRHSYGKVVTP